MLNRVGRRHSLMLVARRTRLVLAGVLAALLCCSACPQYGELPEPDFICNDNDECPRLLIEGDPPLDSYAASPFRGYGDPSLEQDPDTGTLWLSYSWLDHRGSGKLGELQVRTHLARSDDGGASFQFDRAANEVSPASHPQSDLEGSFFHEVSTLVRESDGSWQLLWLRYFDPEGEAQERSDIILYRSLAAAPSELGDEAEAAFYGAYLAEGWREGVALHEEIEELADCAAFTEPGLFSDGQDTYLAVTCLVFDFVFRNYDRERTVLLRQTSSGYAYLGVLLDRKDALALGADTLQQADLSYSRDGRLLLLVTPIREDLNPRHQGCVALEVTDLGSASIARTADGAPETRFVIGGHGNVLGPGLCSYDPDSETGVLMATSVADLEREPADVEFSMHVTGQHPMGGN